MTFPPESEIEFSYARSSGPGGQNVNKVNSKAVLRWDLLASGCFPPELKARLISRLAGKLNVHGEIVISSDRYRDQIRNREDCLQKLRVLLAGAAAVPKKRKKTKPSRSSVREKKELKSHHSKKKRLRRYMGDRE